MARDIVTAVDFIMLWSSNAVFVKRFIYFTSQIAFHFYYVPLYSIFHKRCLDFFYMCFHVLGYCIGHQYKCRLHDTLVFVSLQSTSGDMCCLSSSLKKRASKGRLFCCSLERNTHEAIPLSPHTNKIHPMYMMYNVCLSNHIYK